MSVVRPAVTAAPGGPGNAPFALWARIGVPAVSEQLPSPFGTMLFSPAFLQPADPALLTLSNSLFADPSALLAPGPVPWSVAIPGLGFPLELTLQGIVFDAAAPAGLAVTNALILRVQ